MKRFNKIYIEITNICNLSCCFCNGTKRAAASMSLEEFNTVLDKIKPCTDYIYYHLLGEPLLHEEFPLFLEAASTKGFKSCITTNGSLLGEKGDFIIDFAQKGSLHKISISLQAQEANEDILPLDEYMTGVCEFAKKVYGKTIVVFRLWNEGGLNRNNEKILSFLKKYYPGSWKEHPKGYTLAEKCFLEFGSLFSWPGYDKEEYKAGAYYCYGLKDQLGILVNGDVVPCCLDAEGDLVLGNIFKDNLKDILEGKRASAIYDGFCKGKACEELCRRCGFARRFAR